MSLLEIALLAVGLGGDAFGVALATGPGTIAPRHAFRLALHAGLFQFLMPILGWALGRAVAPILGWVAAAVAAALVIIIGLKMLVQVLTGKPHVLLDISKGRALIGYSFGTSADALTAGISIGLLGHQLLLPALIFGLVAALMAGLGHWLSHFVSALLGRRAEAFGGLVLIGLGVKMLPIW